MAFYCKPRPEKTIGEFLALREKVVIKKYAGPLLNPENVLQCARLRLTQNEDALKAKREEYKERRVYLDSEWKNLESEGEKLKENFVQFSSFLVANQEKRKRMIATIADTRKVINQRQEAIDSLNNNIEVMSKGIKELQEKIKEFSIYETYLANVINCMEDNTIAKNEQGIIERFEYSTELANKLAEKQATSFQILQNAKTELSRFTEVHEEILLSLHTKAAGLQGNYETAIRRTRELETLINHIRRLMKEKYIDVKFTKEAIWTVYISMCLKKKVRPKFAKDNFEEQLVFIQHQIQQYQKLNADMRRILKKSQLKKIKT